MEHFQLLEDHLLGEGAFGKVYQCRWYGVLAAVKQFNVTESEETNDIIHEIQLLKHLQNDNIIQFFGDVHYENKLCLITSLAERGSLRSVLDRHELAKDLKTKVINGMINGMLFLRNRNVVHRDLKSLNVLLDRNFEPKICDFGLAMLKLNSTTGAMTGGQMGTVRWMAPELFSKRPPYSHASDIYALGLVIWEVLTEKIPYENIVYDMVIINEILKGECEDIPNDMPEPYNSMIRRCWHFEPHERITILELKQLNDTAFPTTVVQQNGFEFNDSLPVSIITFPTSDFLQTSPQSLSSVFASLNAMIDPLSVTSVTDTLPQTNLSTELDILPQPHARTTPKPPVRGQPKASPIASPEAEVNVEYAAVASPKPPVRHQPDASSVAWPEEEVNSEYAAVASPKPRNRLTPVPSPPIRRQRNISPKPLPDPEVMARYTDVARQYFEHSHSGLFESRHLAQVIATHGQDFVEWVQIMADQKNPMADALLGEMNFHGCSVPQNYLRARRFFLRSAKQEFVPAEFYMGVMYGTGRGVQQQDSVAAEWMTKAAEKGHVKAQTWLADMYKRGLGVPQSDKKAAAWYQNAAYKGNATAQYRLGDMYKDGQGVPQNDEMAVVWYTRAAEQGHGRALSKLAYMYENGQGVRKNEAKALEWYTKKLAVPTGSSSM